MINKIEVKKTGVGEYRVTYSVDSDKDLSDALRQCKNSIRKIDIKEDADVGLASYGGSYTFDQLDKKYGSDYSFDNMNIWFKNGDTWLKDTWFKYYGFTHELDVFTQDPNFDLDTFLSGKNT